MAELEIHHEVHGPDPMGKTVGVAAAILAVLLAVVTILSHRAHTEGVILKSDANDKWAFYQSKKIKFHSLELGEDLLNAMPARTDTADKTLARYASEKKRYEKDAEKRRRTRWIRRKRHLILRRKRFDMTLGKVCWRLGWCSRRSISSLDLICSRFWAD